MSHDALFQLGMDLEARWAKDTPLSKIEPRSTTQKEENSKLVAGVTGNDDNRLDHFIERDGVQCAGAHLIIDLYDAKRLNDQAYIEETLKRCIDAAGATLLHIHLHPFEPTGVSGVAVLAESHISVHTWPECGYAAFDVFMCGDAKPEVCVDILKQAFAAERAEVNELLRGKEVN
ncbi:MULTISPECIES: adenosylmethionine decarboxylase [Pseudovibrio]|uniref:adenosylmethionine decarboxylase n=1 Tax=Stappiaceae TaxID=2821832 RepID=UPI0023652531|nr:MULTISPECIES: adenosylmethionine decarboxylase [Pseudovibrio]MDD7910258.1 adenosylmethionine decarboxylase [Pseudovibrio exalbescens]MDX5593974.1 adenosylmethionine decarboxylase [Pseudovibrio sp. SPO723]